MKSFTLNANKFNADESTRCVLETNKAIIR